MYWIIYDCIDDYIWNPSACGYECIEACKTDEYQHVEICLFEKHLLDKLVLICEDKILNKFKASTDNKKVTWGKIIYLIHVI